MPAPTLFGWFGNGYTNWGDSIDITSPESNLNWLQVEPALQEQLGKTKANGQVAIVSVVPLMFKYPSTELHADWQKRFGDWWESLPAELTQPIFALAIADEPFRANDKHYHYPIEQVHAVLNMVSGFVRTYTGKQTCMTASGVEYDTWGVPADINWIGMYRYSYNTNWAQLMYSFFNLLRQKQKWQKVIAIVDSYGDTNNPPNENRIKAYNEWWKTFISWSDDVVAVVPFMYQTTTMNGLQVWGGSSLPRVHLELAGWGYKITGRNLAT